MHHLPPHPRCLTDCDGGLTPIPCGKGAFCPSGSAKPTPCPQAHTTTFAENTTAKAGCVCEHHHFNIQSPPHVHCKHCGAHTQCPQKNTTLRTITVDKHAWRPGYGSTDVKLCPHEQVCAGGTTPDNARYDRSSAATCAPGRGLTGAYCSLCVDRTTHFFEAATASCTACSDSQAYAIAILVVAIGALTAAWVGWRRFRATRHLLAAYTKRVSFWAKLRITVSFFQIVTQLDSVYSLRFSAAYAALLNGMAVVNLHLFGWLPGLHPVCFGLPSLESQLWFATLAPLGIALAAFPIAKFAFGQPYAAALPFVLGWTFLLFPAISSRGFRALAPCDCFGFLSSSPFCFLREDFEVECTGRLFGRSSAPPSVLAPAWAAVALWGAGVPLLYAALLCHTDALRGSLGLLLGGYRSGARAWDLVVVSEKLVLVGFLSLLEPGEWTQIFVAVIVALCSFLLQVRFTPYERSSDNLFAFGTSAMLLLQLLGSLALQTSSLAPSLDIDQDLVFAVLFTATLLVLFAAVAFFIFELYAAHAPHFTLVVSGEPPQLSLAPGKTWHLFLSHVRTAEFKLLLQPSGRVCLDHVSIAIGGGDGAHISHL